MPLTEISPNIQKDDSISILKFVSKLEKNEKLARQVEKEREENEGLELAQKLTIEQEDEHLATKLQIEDEKNYFDFKNYKFNQMKQDDQQARLIDLQEREKKFDEEFDRKMTNTISEQKGKKALKKLQKQELKHIYEEMKAQKKEYKKAKFAPLRVSKGVKLVLKLSDVFTTSLSVDTKTQKLVVKVESEPPKIPYELLEYVGDADLQPSKFECDLWFDTSCGNGNVKWDELEVSKSYDKEAGEVSINVTKKNSGEGNMWLRNTEIFAKYKNGLWFW